MFLGIFLSAMIATSPTSQPIGHYDFCKRYSAECQPMEEAPRAKFDQVINLAGEINLHVNESIVSATDLEIYDRSEYWEYPHHVGYGDCEDYVLEKRFWLIDHGIHPSNLLITVVRLPDGEGHAVLTLRTDAGDFILDNLTDQILYWRATDYMFLKRQSTTHAGRWVEVKDETD